MFGRERFALAISIIGSDRSTGVDVREPLRQKDRIATGAAARSSARPPGGGSTLTSQLLMAVVLAEVAQTVVIRRRCDRTTGPQTWRPR